MRYLCLALAASWLIASMSGCASTGAYVQSHPESADEVAIGAAAIGCVDHAIAGALVETPWQTVLVDGLGCIAALVTNHLLKPELEQPAREAVHREVLARQDRQLKTLRALQSMSRDLSTEPLPAAIPGKHGPVSRLSKDADNVFSWNEMIGLAEGE